MRALKELTKMRKTVFITGGQGLLGAEFAKQVLNEGHNVILADIKPNLSELLQSQLKQYIDNNQVLYCQVDITIENSVFAALNKSIEKFGCVDAVVNNAYPRNANYGKDLWEVTYDSFSDNISMNIGGYFLISKIFGKYFMSIRKGNIINIASIYGVIAPRFEIYKDESFTSPVEYSVIKSSIIHLTKYLAKYFKGQNIRVNSISPGGILDKHSASFTGQYAKYCLNKGMLDKQDIVGTLLFLLSDNSRYINGQNIVVDDGFTI